MDIRCTQCGEPWAVDSLHDLVAEGAAVDFSDARRVFALEGCSAFGTSHAATTASPAIAMLTDLLGDDVDGLAAELEDAAALGWL